MLKRILAIGVPRSYQPLILGAKKIKYDFQGFKYIVWACQKCVRIQHVLSIDKVGFLSCLYFIGGPEFSKRSELKLSSLVFIEVLMSLNESMDVIKLNNLLVDYE